MKNQNTKRKLNSILKAAIIGGLLFAGLSLVAIIIGTIEARLPQSDGESEIFYVTAIPFMAIMANWFSPQSGFLLSSIIILVNGLLGVFLFIVPVAFWQFFIKGNRKNKNQAAEI